MSIEVQAESIATLAEYASIPIAFEVDEVFDVVADPSGGGRFTLSARRVPAPYHKDYDALIDNGPVQWPQRFDVSKWGFFGGFADGERVGVAVVAYDTPALDMLEGRLDLAVLWDIRVVPSKRRCGVGSALFETVEAWALARRCRQLKVETQNINISACRFYAEKGCVLEAVHRNAYPELPNEIQLLWYKLLAHRVAATISGGQNEKVPGRFS